MSTRGGGCGSGHGGGRGGGGKATRANVLEEGGGGHARQQCVPLHLGERLGVCRAATDGRKDTQNKRDSCVGRPVSGASLPIEAQ